jgi:hypothetical protein
VSEDASGTPMNTYLLEETYTKSSYSKKVEISATDNAIGKIAPTLGGALPHLRSKTIQPNPPFNSHLSLPIFSDDQLSIEDTSASEKQTQENITVDSLADTVTSSTNLERANIASRFFEKDNKGYLTSLTADYKGLTKKNQQERFGLLYIWAYNQLIGEPVPDKDHIIQAVKQNGLLDKNFSTYFSKLSKYINKSDGAFKLNPSGNSFINKILVELQDDKILGFDLTSGSTKHTNYAPRVNKEVQENIEKWIIMPSRLNSLDIRSIDKNLKLCIVAIFDLTRELKVEQAVTASIAYDYLLKKYKTIPINQRAFKDALCSKSSAKYFSKGADGKYFTTMEADAIVEDIISKMIS